MSNTEQAYSLVERHWRSTIILFDADPNAAANEIFAFEDAMANWTAQFAPLEAQDVRSTISTARAELATRCRQDHLQLRRDLGLPQQGNQLVMNLIANLETATTLDPKMYLHDFWRKAIALPDREKHKVTGMFNELCTSLQKRLTLYSQVEQDAFFTRIAVLNATYMHAFTTNPALIRQIVGAPVEQSRTQEAPLGEVLVKTAIDATVGSGISALLSRLFK